MFLSQALKQLQSFDPDKFESLSDVLSPDIIKDCLEKSGVATVRKRRLPLELMVWSIIGMALYRHIPMEQIVNQLDIMLPGKRPYVAPSAVVQARQRLGENAVREVFEQTQSLWYKSLPISNWCGLKLFGVDSVVWRAPDSAENNQAFCKTRNTYKDSVYPQVRMVCQMELSSHLIVGCSFDSVSKNEMLLCEDILDKTPNESLTLFDKGFYSLGLLHKLQNSGKERHWLIGLKKNSVFKVLRKLNSNESIIDFTSCSRARNYWADLQEKMNARLVSKKIKGKKCYFITSMLDMKKYIRKEIVDLYSQRWEIELGFREMKQCML